MLRPPPPPIDYDQFGTRLTEAIKPLVPKPPAVPNPWDDDDVLLNSGPKSFREGMTGMIKHHINQHYTDSIKQTIDKMQKENETIRGMLTEVLHAMQEDPNYQSINSRALELQKNYNIDRSIALRMARDELRNKPQQQQIAKSIPGHMKIPDTRPASEDEDDGKGEADFRQIISGLVKSGKHGIGG